MKQNKCVLIFVYFREAIKLNSRLLLIYMHANISDLVFDVEN